MGNLDFTGALGDITKGTVSFWVRVPAASAAAAAAAYSPTGVDYEVFNGVIPLITFGAQQEGTIYEWTFTQVYFPKPGEPEVIFNPGATSIVTGNHTNYRPPSYIGIYCDDEGGLWIDTNFQSSSFPVCQATIGSITLYEMDPNEGDEGYYFTLTSVDASYTDEGTPTYFGRTGAYIGAVDEWHHILISWDFTGGCSVVGSGTESNDYGAPYDDYVTSACKMWLSIDDVNKVEDDLPALWMGANGGSADPNTIITELCAQHSGQSDLVVAITQGLIPGPDTYTNYGSPSIVETMTIPSGSVSIPSELSVIKPTDNSGGNTTVAPNLRIQVAEVHVFTDVTVDTSVEANRRNFITALGSPANPTLAADFFGKPPEVYFRTHTDWIAGNNQGTAGDFTPTGTISAYTPGP